MSFRAALLVSVCLLSTFAPVAAAPLPADSKNAGIRAYSISSAEQFVGAVEDGINHIRLVAHLDLRSYDSSTLDAGVLIAVASTLQTITGRCTEPTPVVRSHPPVGQLQPGQCLVQVSTGFLGWFEKAADNVWLDNLYIRGPVHQHSDDDKVNDVLLHWRPQQPAALWLTNVTLQGGKAGLFASAASAHAQGVRVRNCVHGVEAWAGADVSMVDCSWRRMADRYGDDDFVAEAERGEGTRLRFERCRFSQRYASSKAVSDDAFVFVDQPQMVYQDPEQKYFPLHAGDIAPAGFARSAHVPSGAVTLNRNGSAAHVNASRGAVNASAYGAHGGGPSDGMDMHMQAWGAANVSSSRAGAVGGAMNMSSRAGQTGAIANASSINLSTSAGRDRGVSLDIMNLNATAHSARQVAMQESFRQRNARADVLRPRFLSAKNGTFQALQAAVRRARVEPYVLPSGHRKLPAGAEGWMSLPGGHAERTLFLLSGIILALLLALALALGCVIGLCTARTLPAPRDRDAWRKERQAAADERSTEVVRGAGGAGDTAKQRRRRGGEEAVLLPLEDADDLGN
eukprot:jgi/Ulvmu1/2537/UM139_0005.1